MLNMSPFRCNPLARKPWIEGCAINTHLSTRSAEFGGDVMAMPIRIGRESDHIGSPQTDSPSERFQQVVFVTKGGRD